MKTLQSAPQASFAAGLDGPGGRASRPSARGPEGGADQAVARAPGEREAQAR